MKSIYLSLLARLRHILTRGQQPNCEVKKVFISMRFFTIPMHGVTLAKVEIFVLAFLQMSELWSSKVNFLANFTLNSFSASLLSILNPSTFIQTVICTNQKWHLSALPFKRLLLNHSNNPLDGCSRDVKNHRRYWQLCIVYCHRHDWQYQCHLQQNTNLLKKH